MNIRTTLPAYIFAAQAAFTPLAGNAQAVDYSSDEAERAFNAVAQTTTIPVVLTTVAIIANVNSQGQTNGWLITFNEKVKGDSTLNNITNQQMACILGGGGAPNTSSINSIMTTVPTINGTGIQCAGAPPVSVSSLNTAEFFSGIPCSQKITLYGAYYANTGMVLLKNSKGVPFSSVYTYCTVKGKNIGTPSPLSGNIGQFYTVLDPYNYSVNANPAGWYINFQGNILSMPTEQWSNKSIVDLSRFSAKEMMAMPHPAIDYMNFRAIHMGMPANYTAVGPESVPR